ncbi:SMA2 [Candida theae]|uniref:SMA2 n=1 Tax=Candida theae TaxID=1198502 RepID=A0AAD5BBY4_9ASCO|nr:SMA2 [Candida theae]KAI5953078.1 SMA2 [Candida theae]
MQEQDYPTKAEFARYRRERTIGLFWRVCETAGVSCLMMGAYVFLVSCTPLKPKGPGLIKIKIEADSDFAKNTLELIQQSLKFATYLSNDLSSFVNQTTSDSILQQLDTLYNGNTYQLNTFGYCRQDQMGNRVGCYFSDGLNLVVCLLQDVGFQLRSITSSDDEIEDQFVNLYYNAINQACSYRVTTTFPCVLQLYNAYGKLVQWLAVAGICLPMLVLLLSIVDLILYVFLGVSSRMLQRIRLGTLATCGVCLNLIYILTYLTWNEIGLLVEKYEMGRVELQNDFCISLNIVLAACLVLVGGQYYKRM